MGSLSTLEKRKSRPRFGKPGGAKERLRPQNKKLLRWLDSWISTPDDRDEKWWTEFDADFAAHTVNLRPNPLR